MKAILVNCDSGDWEGLYIDGTLVAEGHSLSAYQVLEALGGEYKPKCIEVKADWLDGNGLPQTVGELPE